MIERPFIRIEQKEFFARIYPGATIEEPADIPLCIFEEFEHRSRRFIHPRDYTQGLIDEFFIVRHPDATTTHGAVETKRYHDGEVEKMVHIYDVDTHGVQTGHGEIRFNITSDADYFRDKPFVGYTHTETGFRQRGLGGRRLLTMERIAFTLFGLHLHSDTKFIDDAPKRLWEYMIGKGLARHYRQTGESASKDRYCFVDRDAPGQIQLPFYSNAASDTL